MQKADLVHNIARETGIPKVDILVILETFFAEVKTTVATGEPVTMRGFGTFTIRKRAAKKGFDIRKSVAIDIPDSVAPVFKPAAEFAADVRNLNTTTAPAIKEARAK